MRSKSPAEVRSFLNSSLRHARVGAIVGAALSISGALAAAQDPRARPEIGDYRSEALVLLNIPPGASPVRGEGERSDRGEVAVRLVTSEPIRRAVLKEKDVAELPFIKELKDPAEWYERHVSATLSRNGTILKIRVQAPDRRTAVTLSREVAFAIVVDRDNNLDREQEDRVQQLRQVAETLEGRIKDYQRMSVQVRRSSGSVATIRSPRELETERLEVRRELRAMNLRLIEADVRTERLAQASKENASLRGELREWQDKQAVLKAQLTSLQVEEADLARTSAVASRVQDEADSRRDEVERLRANRRRLLDEAETLQSPPQRHASAEILFIESE